MFSPALIVTLVLLAASTGLGTLAVRKMIRVHEAKHELREGSAGFLRALKGWSWVGIWLLFTWLTASVLGDWHHTDDLSGALERAELRVYLIFEIVSALAESDH